MKIYVNSERENLLVWLESARKNFKAELNMCYRRAFLKTGNPMSIPGALGHLKETVNHVLSDWFKNYTKLPYSAWTCKCGNYRGIKFKDVKCKFCKTEVILRIKGKNIMSGKGDKRRPQYITQKELAERWEAAFGKREVKNVAEEKPKELINKEVISFE